MPAKLHILAALATGAIVLSGCRATDPKPPPATAVVTAAGKNASARQPLSDARNYSSEADRKSAEARIQLGDAKSGLEEYRGRVLSLSELVRKLRDQGSAAADDLKQLYDELAQQDAYIERMVDKLGDVQSSLEAERGLRRLADEKLNEANDKILAKDAEADHLRLQLGDAQTTIAKLEGNAADNYKAAQEAKGAEERMKGQRDLIAKVLIGVAALLMISLIINYIQFRKSSLLF